MEMPQARDQASLTPNQETLSGKRRHRRWTMAVRAFPAAGPLPRGAREGRSGRGGRAMPRPEVRAQAAPSPGLATSLLARPGSTQTSPPTPPTPPPAESWEDAELGLRSGGHRSGHSPGGRLWEKFRVATGGGVEKAKPRPVGFPTGRHSGPDDRAPSPSALTDPPAAPGSSQSQAPRLSQRPSLFARPSNPTPQPRCAAAPPGQQLLSPGP